MKIFVINIYKAALLIFLGYNFLFGQNNVSYISAQFFEAGNNPPPLDERYYATTFQQSTARSIYYEVHLENNLYNIRDNEITIRTLYYRPDGTLLDDFSNNYTISSSWETSYNWAGWGWDDAGNWDTGTYRVDIYLDGVFADSKYFTISGTSSSDQYTSGVEDTWDGDWRGRIYHDDDQGNLYARIVISGTSATQYFQNKDGSWEPVYYTDRFYSEYYRNNFILAWIDHGEVWTETQMLSISWKSRGVAEVLWTRHVNNRREEVENETWYVKGTGILVRQ